jgi:DNA (cytosine-5)-methyltransferase 1
MAVEEVFGATTAWFSEYDAAPSKILAHHYPDVPNYGDMTKIDWASIEHVDIISGGTPCQDLSAAGRRAGMTEGTRSNLWVQMREAIAIQRPTYVVWENVRGAFSAKAASDLEHCPRCMGETGHGGPDLRALGRVLGDLSDLGFDAEWRGVRASEVGACHARFRVFVLAKNTNPATRSERRQPTPGQAKGGRSRPDAGGRSGALAFADSDDPGRGEHGRTVTVQTEHAAAEYAGLDAADAFRLGYTRGWEARATSDTLSLCGERRGIDGNLAGTSGTGQSDGSERERYGDAADDSQPVNWGDYEPAIRRWEAVLDRPAPRPTEPTGRNGSERLSPRFTEFMMGLEEGWVTDPAIGISRNEQLKACGNGVVPQQAIAALRDMLAAFQTAEVAA